MFEKRTWDEFRSTGLLWWVNSILHLFGWAISIEYDNNGNIIDSYPARVKFRGFDEKSNTEGYIKVSKYLEKNIKELRKEAEE